jgi:hypothetical protein
MIIAYISYDGLTYRNQEDCLEHEVCARKAEVLTASIKYTRYREKEHGIICKQYFFIKKLKSSGFEKENSLYTNSMRRKVYWQKRKLLKKLMEASVEHLTALKKDFQEKRRLLKEAKTELAKVEELIKKNENKI